MADVKIKCVHTVKPSEPTFTGTFPLSEWDHAAGTGYIMTIYFYKPTSRGIDDVVSVLKESISRCLVHFYPMAGRVHRVAGGRLELHCNAMGIELIEAETSSELADMGDFSESEKFKHLIYSVDRTKPVHELAQMYVQVTRFRCGSFSLGLTMTHALFDGVGGLHFTYEWARLSRGEPLERTPYLKRDVLRAEKPPCGKHLEEQKEEMTAQAPPPFKETTTITLTLTRKQVEKLKMAANASTDGKNGSQHPYSRFEVLTAHIWRCACKAKGHDGDEPNALGFCIDARSRIRPPLPPDFWGNAVLIVATKSQAGELITEPLGSGCSKVRSTIEKVTNEYIWSDIEHLNSLDDISVWRGFRAPEDGLYVYPNVMVISWLALNIYGRDFGWGEEIYMGPAAHTHEGTAMILPGRGEKGSAVIAICLQVAHVDKFRHHFYEDLVEEN